MWTIDSAFFGVMEEWIRHHSCLEWLSVIQAGILLTPASVYFGSDRLALAITDIHYRLKADNEVFPAIHNYFDTICRSVTA